MLKLLKWTLKTTLCSNKFLIFFIMLSITASFFCMNVFLGYAEENYRSTIGINYYSTIGIVSSTDSLDATALKSHIENNSDLDISNILQITTFENTCIIGWDGSAYQRWFPHVSGRFFNDDEIQSAEKVAYVSSTNYTADDVALQNKIDIAGIEYSVIGRGWITNFNISSSISKNLPQSIFYTSSNSQHSLSDDYIYRIIPYTTFLNHFFPDIILIQFESPTRDELHGIADNLTQAFPDLIIELSDKDSDQLYIEEKTQYMLLGCIFSLLIGTSLIGMISLWLKSYKQKYMVYYICGASPMKIYMLVWIQLFILFFVGELIALIMQFLLSDILAYIGVGYLPSVMEIGLVLIIYYLITCICLSRQIKLLAKIEKI